MAAESASPTDDQADAREIRARLWSFIRRRVADDATADDVTQDVLVRWMTNPPAPDAPLIPWLLVVARNALADRHRRRGRAPQVMALPDEPAATPEEADDLSPLLQCVHPLLEALPPADREVLERFDLAGGSATAAAHETGESPSTSRSRLRRARLRLRGLIEQCCTLDYDGRGHPIAIAGPKCKSDDSPCGGGCAKDQ